MELIVYVMFLHFLADFVFQSDEMAQNKYNSLYWLTYHIGTYGLVLSLGLHLVGISTVFEAISFEGMWLYLLVNMGLYFMVDFVTSKITHHYWDKKEVHKFFVTIGFDQFLHFACLYLTLGVLQ